MKLQRILFLSLAVIVSLTTTTLSRTAHAQGAQAGLLYQQMSQDERRVFVAEQARRIAREMSGTEYEFTADFEATLQKFVDKYARRIGNNAGERDARPVFERGVANAPALISAFKAQNVSPLIGLYLPLIESEYVNLQTPSPMGAIGMFQFLPQTGRRYGLTAQELLDVEKSAAAAARYIADNLKQFKDDPMKEALALLAYNRGEQKTVRALQLVMDEQNRRCSICALTAASIRLDASFQKENVHYVPSFFAAAIVGENPQAFGLQQQPLSSYEAKR
jgi:hypothetical protein